MSDTAPHEHSHPHAEGDVGASPTRIANPALRLEANRAAIWAGVIGLAVLAVYLAQSLLVIFGALVFAAMLDGGARLLGRFLPIGRGWCVAIVLLLGTLFTVWLVMFAGSQIAEQAAQFPALITEQAAKAVAWLRSKGVAISQDDIQGIAGSLVSGVGTVTRAIGGVFGALTTLLLIVIIGIYLAIDPRPYERGLSWMVPETKRDDLADTLSHMAYTMRRLLAGRLLGMFAEGIFTYVALTLVGVPMAALLGLITGILAFIPNIGAIISGVLMVLVGFSGGTEMGLWTIGIYLAVQNFDGYVLVPMIAKKTVDLAPALVLGFQLIMGVLFGVLGLTFADPMLAMIKVALERRSHRLEEDDEGEASSADGAEAAIA
ncbi:pheromone autoinducer 2 transporter [Tsuneonella dongtanensis]|uniref:Pheromone autoinducer 2 transporter n=1 Tax=Tsuneonella dongtanensis TaxID=692370 RepID=A0A1B2ADC6_9SPHN|nr:AI-2E family transporter [Tsuneonella dongtanensis]ANY20134.1 pheromone autoinducer 2 transporter [Tsuneonella dongtanensis]